MIASRMGLPDGRSAKMAQIVAEADEKLRSGRLTKKEAKRVIAALEAHKIDLDADVESLRALVGRLKGGAPE